MSTSERDELDNVAKLMPIDHDPWTGRDVDVLMVKHSDARRIVDDLKAKLAEVTRERDATREGYRELGERYDVAKRQIEWLNKQLYGSDGYIETAKNLRIELNDRAKERDEAREQLEAAQAEAAAMREAIDTLPKPSGSHYGDPRYSSMVTSDVIKRCRDAANTTAGRDLQEEMRRKDERIAELERTWDEVRDDYEARITKLESENYRYGESYQELEDYCARIDRKCRTAKASLVEHYRDKIDPAWFKDQPTPEPVYWRMKSKTREQRFGHADERSVDGVTTEYSLLRGDEIHWYPNVKGVTVDGLDGSPELERCNRDGTPLVKPEPVEQAEPRYVTCDGYMFVWKIVGDFVYARNKLGCGEWFAVSDLDPATYFPASHYYACNERGERIEDHSADAGKMVPAPSADDSLLSIARELRIFLRMKTFVHCGKLDWIETGTQEKINAMLLKLRDAKGGAA